MRLTLCKQKIIDKYFKILFIAKIKNIIILSPQMLKYDQCNKLEVPMNIRTLPKKISHYMVLLKYFNCALASFASLQKASGDNDEKLQRSVSELYGGCVACGLTCGVATGGALGVGLMNEDLLENGLKGEMTLVEMTGNYMDWFRKTHGSSLCRDHTGVDFHTVRGQLLYLLSGVKVARCMGIIGRTLSHLADERDRVGPRPGVEDIPEEPGEIRHCARNVLEQIRIETGLGNKRLEGLSVVFDGGVGLKGEVCGAFVGALLAINLADESDLQSAGIPGNVDRFVRRHISLVRKRERDRVTWDKKKSYATGKELVTEFIDRFGTMGCSELCGVPFRNSGEFIDHITRSPTCHEIMDFAADRAVRALSVN